MMKQNKMSAMQLDICELKKNIIIMTDIMVIIMICLVLLKHTKNTSLSICRHVYYTYFSMWIFPLFFIPSSLYLDFIILAKAQLMPSNVHTTIDVSIEACVRFLFVIVTAMNILCTNCTDTNVNKKKSEMPQHKRKINIFLCKTEELKQKLM